MPQRIVRVRSRFSALCLPLAALALGCAKPGDRPAQTGDGANPGAAPAAGTAANPGTGIVVNGTMLTAETVTQLQQLYPVAVPPGRYWYDAVSGAYGREGEPIVGQMLPGLALGGPLAADASRGTSGVFVNGRQLTSGETIYIERMCQTPVIPGRYWIMANGAGGYEGQPAIFNLSQCPGVPRQGGGGGGSSSRTYCDPNGACTTSGILGTITTVPD